MGGQSLFAVQSAGVSGVRVVAVRGEIDLSNAHALLSALTAIAQEHTHEPVLIDLSELQYIDAQAVHALEAFAEYSREQRRPIALTGSCYPVHRILNLLDVEKIIPLFDSREAAINFLTSSTA